MKIGFSKGNLLLNSKEFNPFNIPLKNVTIESDIPVAAPNASDILSAFQKPNIREASRLDGIDILKSMIEQAK